MIVRDARREDLPAVVELHNELLDVTTYTWTERPQTLDERTAVFERNSARGFPLLVAVENDAVCGAASYGDFRDSIRWPGYRTSVEHSVNVFQRAWGSGIGRLLMGELIERARRAGIHTMIGGIDATNQRSLSFHERLGFREVGRLPETGFKHGRWCDLVFVQRFVARVAPQL
jgi:phosphinothricin acetyltransferase